MATLIPIHDLDDPRVAEFRNVRDRDLRGLHDGRFVAEGESVIRVLLAQSRLPALSVLAADNRLDVIASLLDAHDIPVFVAPQRLMEEIVGFPIHRGLLALGRRTALPSPAAVLAGHPPIAIGLAGIANHDNVGGIFRNAAAFGVRAALVDRATADPLYRKAVRVSVGGVLRVPYAVTASAETMRADFAAAGYRVLSLSPHGRFRLSEIDHGGPIALMLGAEGPGLPAPVLASTLSVRIDMAAGFDSLNVATTAGIALYELVSSPAATRLW